jgi:hypothetical protein
LRELFSVNSFQKDLNSRQRANDTSEVVVVNFAEALIPARRPPQLLRSRNRRTQAVQLIDAIANDCDKSVHRLLVVVGCAKRVAKLFVAKLTEKRSDPSRILDRDVLHHPFLAFLTAAIARLEYRREHAHLLRSSVVVEFHHAVLHTENELTRAVVFKRIFGTFAAEAADFAERRADVSRYVTGFQLTRLGVCRGQHVVVANTRVVVGKQNHQHFQALELARFEEGI